MKHIKKINEISIPFTVAFGSDPTSLQNVTVYQKEDFEKFNKEVLQKCGKLKKKYSDPQKAIEYFESKVSNSPIFVWKIDANDLLMLNYNPQTNSYEAGIHPYGWGSSW